MNGHSLNGILSKINEIVVSSGIEYNLYDIARLFYKNVIYFCNTFDFQYSYRHTYKYAKKSCWKNNKPLPHQNIEKYETHSSMKWEWRSNQTSCFNGC